MFRDSSLERVTRILHELGGYFTFTDQDGTEYVVAQKQDFDARVSKTPSERQLSLPVASAEDLLEKINRDIAVYHLQQEGDETSVGEVLVEEVVSESASDENVNPPAPRRVRFEPLRGDLPPDLQE